MDIDRINSSILERLSQSFDARRLAQCYLFYGDPDSTFRETAVALAEHVLSQNTQNPYSFNQEMTRKYLQQQTHPNFFMVRSSDVGGEIVIEQAHAMKNFLQSTPSIPGWRVVLIDLADQLNHSASNALLKILEELPEQVTVLMLSNSLAKIKKTLISRSQKVFFNERHHHVQKCIQENAWGKEIIAAVDRTLFEKKLPNLLWMETLGKDSEKRMWFPRIILYHLHDCAMQHLKNFNDTFARKYEVIADFLITADGKALSPTHFIYSVFLLLQNNNA